MFGIFNKKKDLFPILKNVPDIHCHILPGIDDGAKTTEDSHKMLEEYERLEMLNVYATPHILAGTYPNTPQSITEAEKVLAASAPKSKADVIAASAEHMLDEAFLEKLENAEVMPLKKEFLLVEMSYHQPPINLNEMLFCILDKGYVPILAHPERYNFINNFSVYQDLIDRGCLLQLNLLSLTKHYGENTSKKAQMLLKNKAYTYLGTDAHHDKHLKKIQQIQVSNKVIDEIKRIAANNQADF